MCKIKFSLEKLVFPPKDCNFFGKMHFDEKYFFKIYFNLKCNFFIKSKIHTFLSGVLTKLLVWFGALLNAKDISIWRLI